MAGIIERLREKLPAAIGGGKSAADPVAATAAAIAGIDQVLDQARVERVGAEAQLRAADAERDALLLAGADAQALRRHDARTAELRDVIRAIGLLAQQQQRRRAELLAQLRGHHLAAALGEVSPLVAKFLAAARAAHSAAGELAALVGRGEARGLHEIRAIVEAPPWIYRDTLFFDQYETAVAQRLDAHQRPAALATTSAPATAAKPVAAPPPPQVAGQAAAARAGRAGPGGAAATAPIRPAAVAPAKANGTAPPAPRPPSIRKPGYVAVEVVRPGYEDPDEIQRAAGETVWLPPATAEAALRAGAVTAKEMPK